MKYEKQQILQYTLLFKGIGFRFNCYKQEYLKSYIEKLTFD